MATKKIVKFIQMLPNDTVQCGNSLEISSNIFCDLELVISKNKMIINIVGVPPVKKIVYGQTNTD